MPDENLFQTVTRNLAPKADTSRAALGPSGVLSQEPSPQQAGEQQYKEKFGSPQEVAYGKLKNWLSEHEQHFSDKVLKPFRQGLDNMAEDLQTAAESGTTKSGGQLTPVTRALAAGTSAALKAVPVGGNVKETVAGMIAPPELSEEKAALDFSKIEGHTLVEAAPEYAYRARDVGEKGVPAVARSHAQATMSEDEARMYLEHRGKTTGKAQELVRFNVSKLDPEHYTRKAGPGSADWVKLNRSLEESEIEKMEPGAESDLEMERRTRTEIKRPAPQKEEPK